MGLLKWYVIREVFVNNGSGGHRSDAGAGIALIMAIMVVVLGILYAIRFIGLLISHVIYHSVRPILMIEPTVGALAGGFVIALFLTHLIGASENAAEKLLKIENGSTDTFYTETAALIGALNLFLLHIILSEGDLLSYWIIPFTDNIFVHLFLNLLFIVVFFYLLYELFRLPYRLLGLLQCCPKGRQYAIGCLLPLTTPIVAGTFNLPTIFVYVPSLIAVNAVLLGPLLLIKKNEGKILNNSEKTVKHHGTIHEADDEVNVTSR